MSWDVVMIRTNTNSEAMEEIEDENIIPFKQTEIDEELKKISSKLGIRYDGDYLVGNGWSIGFSTGEDDETESVMLQIRGSELQEEVLALLMADLNARLLDCSTGEFIEPGVPTSFESWKAYRDKVIPKKTIGD